MPNIEIFLILRNLTRTRGIKSAEHSKKVETLKV